MRLLIHDHAGYPFSVQLSRHLAARGHEVCYSWSSTFQSPNGPSLSASPQPRDDRLALVPIRHRQPFEKYRWLKRSRQECEFAWKTTRLVQSFNPDIVLSSNVPLITHSIVARSMRRQRVPHVAWLQDIYSLALKDLLPRHRHASAVLGRVGSVLEAGALRSSSKTIVISEGFVPVLESWGIDRRSVEVIPNWAPVTDLPVLPKDNSWARSHGLHDRFVYLYTGILGLKHDPRLFAALAEREAPFGRLVAVVSEGPGAQWLSSEADRRGLANLRVLPFADAREYPEVLAAGDVLLAQLTAHGGELSVPSKITTYLCARRPILAAIPADNAATELLVRSGAGLVVGPTDISSFLTKARVLAEDQALRDALGSAGRVFAEETFAIGPIAERFEDLLRAIATATSPFRHEVSRISVRTGTG